MGVRGLGGDDVTKDDPPRRVRRSLTTVGTVALVTATAGFIVFSLVSPLLPLVDARPGWSWVVGGVVVLVVADRLLLAAERRGWVYWRHSKASSTSLGTAMLAVQSILEPDKEHVVEERRRADREESEDGDPPDPDS